MTAKQYYFCVTEAANYKDIDAYVSDLALSAIWGDTPDAPIPPERLDQLRSIYTAASRTVREIVAAVGMTQAAFAERFCVPRRTVEDWCRGITKCPMYTRLLIQQSLGLFTPPIK
nr:MAG TPA: Regulatory protein [Caudoviricetes sp.]